MAATGIDRLHDRFSSYKEFMDRMEAERFAPVYNLLEDTLIKIESGAAPDPEDLRIIRNFLMDNRDRDGIADETINVIDSYLKGIRRQ